MGETDASEVVQAGPRLLDERGLEVASLRAALAEGEQSGVAASYDIESIIAEAKARRAP